MSILKIRYKLYFCSSVGFTEIKSKMWLKYKKGVLSYNILYKSLAKKYWKISLVHSESKLYFNLIKPIIGEKIYLTMY